MQKKPGKNHLDFFVESLRISFCFWMQSSTCHSVFSYSILFVQVPLLTSPSRFVWNDVRRFWVNGNLPMFGNFKLQTSYSKLSGQSVEKLLVFFSSWLARPGMVTLSSELWAEHGSDGTWWHAAGTRMPRCPIRKVKSPPFFLIHFILVFFSWSFLWVLCQLDVNLY